MVLVRTFIRLIGLGLRKMASSRFILSHSTGCCDGAEEVELLLLFDAASRPWMLNDSPPLEE